MLRSIRKLTLRGKLYIYLIPFVAITCLSISYFLFSDLKQSLSEENYSSVKKLSYQAKTKADNYISTSQTDADFFSSTKDIKDLLSGRGLRLAIDRQKKILSSFKQLQTSKPQYREVYVFSIYNDLITYHSDDVFYEPNEIINNLRDFIDINKTKNKATPKFTILREDEGERLYILSPVVDSARNIGFVILAQDLREFTSMAFDFSSKDNEKVIYRYGSTTLHELGEVESLLLSDYLKTKKNTALLSDKHWINHSKKTIFGDALAFKDTTNFYTKLSNIKKQIVVITIFIISIFVLIIWLVVDNVFIKPLKRVGVAAKQISKGTYKNNSLPKSGDEIGALSSSIDLMAISLRENTNQVSRLAYEDDLTSLSNKKAFLKSITRKRFGFNTSENLTVWVLNLKSFKQINNIHGYEVGNEMLKKVSTRLTEIISQFASRHHLLSVGITLYKSSADEFLIESYLEASDSVPNALSKTIISQLASPILIDGREFFVSGNIGWAQSNNNHLGLATYQNANMAMHEGKKHNNKITKFNEIMIKRIKDNQNLSDNIKRALEIDEFELHYQPKCHLETPSESNEFEALIRWFSSEGSISPAVFIPFAEDANLINHIDFWVTEKVIKDVAALEAIGYKDFTISFNISGQRITDPKFIEVLKFNIEKYKIDAKHLQVEITEHSLINDIDSSIKSIKLLRELSISVALDDFGTGHSSLGYLQHLPLETLKIDRCFIQDVDKNKNKEQLLKHILAIGKDMNLQMVAEGVETAGELSVLKNLGCDLVQGYLFHKPMPLCDAIKLMK